MSAQAVIEVLTNSTLFHQVVAFIPGVPYFVLQFRDSEFAEHTTTKPSGESCDDALWQVAIRHNNRRVLSALKELSEVPAYASSRHARFYGVRAFSVTATKDLSLLNWISDNFLEEHHRFMGADYIQVVVKQEDFVIVEWLRGRDRNYVFRSKWIKSAATAGNLNLVRFLRELGTTNSMKQVVNNAVESGNLELVRYLHEHELESWSTAPLAIAARNGHIDIIKFLHANRNEGCPSEIMGYAFESGHFGVLDFLCENYDTPWCSTASICLVAKRGQLECVKYAHAHFPQNINPWVMFHAVARGHLDIVEFLHENRPEGCAVTSVFEAEKNGHLEVVDFLCQHRPMENPQPVVEQANQVGLHRLARSLAMASETRERFQYAKYYSEV